MRRREHLRRNDNVLVWVVFVHAGNLSPGPLPVIGEGVPRSKRGGSWLWCAVPHSEACIIAHPASRRYLIAPPRQRAESPRASGAWGWGSGPPSHAKAV